MIPVTQTEVGPTNPRANCLMACVASILEVELHELPDVYELEQQGRHWFEILTDVLAKYQLRPVEGGPRDSYHIGVGPSPRGPVPHAVVMIGEAIAHDPHPSRDGFAGHCGYWISFQPC